jgi:hypothetical protein
MLSQLFKQDPQNNLVNNPAKSRTLELYITAAALLFCGRICKSQGRTERAAAAWKSAENVALFRRPERRG